MTDLQELMALPAKWRTEAKHDVECGFHSAGAARRLCANELETILRSPAFAEVARDAERYRWLRECSYEDEMLIHTSGGSEILTGADLDTAIDAAASGGGHG